MGTDTPSLRLIRRQARQAESALETTIRPELNLEKWPAIWHPSKSASKLQTKTINRNTVLPNEAKTSFQIKIAPNIEYGNLTTEDQKVYYGLIHLWEQQGMPTEITFSLNHLMSTLKKPWCDKSLKFIKQSLLRLRGTLFVWTNAYYDSRTKRTIEELDTFTILSHLKIRREKAEHSSPKQTCRARFHEFLDANLRHGYTRPLLLTVMGFKSGLAQLLYGYLQLMLHKRSAYERRTDGLFADLGLKGKAYQYPSDRKQALEKALVELQDVAIPTGRMTITLAPVSDGTDWKIVAVKRENVETETNEVQPPPQHGTNAPPVERKDKQATTPKLPDPATELIHNFLTGFGLPRTKPTTKELTQARDLIAQRHLTPEQGRSFVAYSRTAARRTNFDVKTFGGIVLYVEAFLAERHPPPRQTIDSVDDMLVEHPDANEALERERLDQLGQELLDRLPDAERQTLLEEEIARLHASDKKKIYERWSAETLNEHARLLVGRRLASASAGTPIDGS